MIKKLFMVSLFVLLFSESAFAGWVNVDVAKYHITPEGNLVIYSASEVDPICKTNGTEVKVYDNVNGVTKDGLKHMIATVMLATATDKTISVNVDTSSSACYVSEILITK